MVWTTSEIPNQVGRVALVTGANSGLGFETTKALLGKGATVIMGCRSIQKAKIACKKLRETTDSGIIELLEIDLADLIEVSRASDHFTSRFRRLDLLINNAGVMAPPRTISKQGLESQFAVNHLAHMTLTLKLLPLMATQSGSRVITVSSGAQYMGKMDWDDLQGEKNYDRWASYSQSKLANVMFSLELHKRLQKSDIEVSSLSAHPGLARTNLQSNSVSSNGDWQEALAYKFMNPIFQNAYMGALPQLLAATNPIAKSGEQYCPRFNFRGYPKTCKIAPKALVDMEREKLWHLSEKIIREFVNSRDVRLLD